jgi:hypothetical protein
MFENKERRLFKYQHQIDQLLAIGCRLPELSVPEGIAACRFAFSDERRQSHSSVSLQR